MRSFVERVTKLVNVEKFGFLGRRASSLDLKLAELARLKAEVAAEKAALFGFLREGWSDKELSEAGLGVAATHAINKE